MSAPSIIGTLPAPGWVVERIEPDGSKTVLPLVGFAVLADGQIKPLPLDLPTEWHYRPSNGTQDESLVRRAASRLAQPLGPLVMHELDDETTNPPAPVWWR